MPDYTNYNNGYNGYGGYQPVYPRSYHPAISAMQAPAQNLIKVTGYEGANAYQMPPNSVTALFDGNRDVFYIKSTDGAGFPTIKAFAFTALEPEQEKTSYVTREEFEELKGMILNGKQPVRKAKPAADDE